MILFIRRWIEIKWEIKQNKSNTFNFICIDLCAFPVHLCQYSDSSNLSIKQPNKRHTHKISRNKWKAKRKKNNPNTKIITWEVSVVNHRWQNFSRAHCCCFCKIGKPVDVLLLVNVNIRNIYIYIVSKCVTLT